MFDKRKKVKTTDNVPAAGNEGNRGLEADWGY